MSNLTFRNRQTVFRNTITRWCNKNSNLHNQYKYQIPIPLSIITNYIYIYLVIQYPPGEYSTDAFTKIEKLFCYFIQRIVFWPEVNM